MSKVKLKKKIQARRVGVFKPIYGFRLDPALIMRVRACAIDNNESAAVFVARALTRCLRNPGGDAIRDAGRKAAES